MTRLVAALLLVAAPVWAGVYGSDRGRRPAALEPCDEHWDLGRRAQARQCYSELSVSPDLATRAEAWWALGNVKLANDVFRDALKAEPENPDLRVRWGYLFEQTHQEGEALALFNEALEIDENHVPAKLGSASVLSGRFEDKSKKIVEEALEEQDDQTLGHYLLARMALEEGDLKVADEQLDVALEKAAKLGVSPLEGYALKSSLDLLRGKTESEWTRKALERNAEYGRIYAEQAHFYIITRRYREAIELYAKAVATDPELWSAHADLGVNLLRENRDDEARRHLEIAYKGDPFSAKTVNTLRLVDSFEKFKLYSNKDLVLLEDEEKVKASLDSPEIILRLHEKEAELLRPYVMELAEQSVAKFSEKYRFKPKQPIYVELYPDHDDFAVRTMGMPGIGLLGVTFGYLVAMDSPAGREPGQFHWGTTLWHEMAHVFTLEATNHLVPRWYSEGVSMHEEWQARPHWGERISPSFIKAFTGEKLLPIADLDKGFIRPSYPEQIAVSYFQAGLVCEFIDRDWSAEKLVELLEAFGDNLSTAAAIEKVLGLPPTEFDERFTDFLNQRLGAMADEDGLENWRSTLKQALAAAREENWDTVIEFADRARDLYPDFVESGNPYTLLAKAHEALGDEAGRIEVLEAYFKRGGRDPEQLKALAKLQRDGGRPKDAIETLDEVLYVWPADEDLHAELGELLFDAGRTREALREFSAVLAMNPHDKARAHFHLAETYHKIKDSQRARRHVLMALEIAPTYKPAQKLLLEIAR